MAMTRQEIELIVKARNEAQSAFDQLAGQISKVAGVSDQASAGLEKVGKSAREAGTSSVAAGVAVGTFLEKMGEAALHAGKEMVVSAARTQGMAAVAQFLGEKAGKTRAEIDGLAATLNKQGISMQQSQATIIQLSRAHIDLSNATKLAAAAQNSAFIAGLNSSQALEMIVHGIQTLQPELLRTAGFTVSLETELMKAAKASGRVTTSFTEQEKQMLLLNAVLKQADDISGTYALSMQFVGKQLASLPRFLEDAGVAVGTKFLPALSLAVTGATEFLKIVREYPDLFATAGVAIAAVAGPLLAARAAALLGIPSFAALSTSVLTAAGSFTILAGAATFADITAGIQLIGEAAGLTIAKLGLLGTAGAVLGTAYVSWKVGRAVAEFFDLDRVIGETTSTMLGWGSVASEVGGAKQDSINMAIRRGAEATIDFTEAIRYNAEWLQRRNVLMKDGPEALARLVAEQDHFKVKVTETSTAFNDLGTGGPQAIERIDDGTRQVTMTIGTATDAVHKFRKAIEDAAIHAPKIEWPKPPGAGAPMVLNPGAAAKDALQMIQDLSGAMETSKNRIAGWNQEISRVVQAGAMAALTRDIQVGVLSTKDLAEAYHIGADAIDYLKKQLKDQAEAQKKANEESKKWDAVMAELASATGDYQAILNSLSGDTVEAVKYYLAAGVSQETLAKAYDLTNVQIKAVVASLKAEEEQQKVMEDIHAKTFDLAQQHAKQWRDEQQKHLDAANKAVADSYLKNYGLAKDANEQYSRLVMKSATTTVNFQIAEVRRWQDEQEGLIDYGRKDWEDAYNAIGRLADAKVREIVQSNNQIFKSLRDVVGTVKQAVDGSFAQMLLGAKSFHDGFIDIWHSLKAGVERILASLLQTFIDGFLKGMLTALAGQRAGYSAAFTGLLGGASNGSGGFTNYASLLGLASHGGLWGAGASGALTATNSASVGGTLASTQYGGYSALPGGAGGASAAWGTAAGAAGIAVSSWMLGQWLGKYFENKGAGAAVGAGAGFATGAAIGSVVPGVGTLIGGGIGAAAGAIAGWRAAGKAYEETKKQRADLEKNFGGVEGLIKSVGDAFAYTGRKGSEAEAALKQLWGAKNIEQYNAALQKIGPVLEQYQKEMMAIQAAQKYGLGLGDLSGNTYKDAMQAQFQALQKDQAALEAAGISHDKILKQMAPAYNELLAAALKSGQGVPAALKPIIDQLQKMHLLTEDNIKALLGLGDAAEPDFQELTRLASTYGITLQQLGPKFQQADVSAQSKQIKKDFDALVAAGADAGGVIAGMAPAISKVVQESIKFGTEIPDNMRAMIQVLIDTGQLLDENGEKITDIGKVKFADPVEDEADKLSTAIEKLAEVFEKAFGDGAEDSAKRAREALEGVGRTKVDTVDIPWRWREEDDSQPPDGFLPGDDGRPPVTPRPLPGAAGGIYATGREPVATWFGEGGQPEVGGPVGFFEPIFGRIFDRYFPPGGPGGWPTPTPFPGGGGSGEGGDLRLSLTFVLKMGERTIDTVTEEVVVPGVIDAVRRNTGGARTDLQFALGLR